MPSILVKPSCDVKLNQYLRRCTADKYTLSFSLFMSLLAFHFISLGLSFSAVLWISMTISLNCFLRHWEGVKRSEERVYKHIGIAGLKVSYTTFQKYVNLPAPSFVVFVTVSCCRLIAPMLRAAKDMNI